MRERPTINQRIVIVETDDTQLAISSGDNLLDALLDSNHEIDYQCRSGYCGSCRIQCVSGKVKYNDFPLAHLNSDEILPCCCRVTEPLKLAIGQRQQDSQQQGELFAAKKL